MPDAQALAKLRRAIDRKSHLMKRSLLGEGLRKEFLGGVSLDEGKAAKAFAAQNKENALKTKPKVSKPSRGFRPALGLHVLSLTVLLRDALRGKPRRLSTTGFRSGKIANFQFFLIMLEYSSTSNEMRAWRRDL